MGTNVTDLWPWSLTFFLITLTLLITFQQSVPEFSYFIWIFLLLVWNLLTLPFHIFKKPIIYNKIMKIRAFVLHMSISCEKIFVLVSRYLSFDFGHICNCPLSGAFVFHKHNLFFFTWAESWSELFCRQSVCKLFRTIKFIFFSKTTGQDQFNPNFNK